MDYRLYFIDSMGAIKAREEFTAPDDEAAKAVTHIVADVCSEEYAGYELWSFARCVSKGPEAAPALLTLEDLEQSRQESVLGLEDALQRGRWSVANSKRLIEKTGELRSLLRSMKPKAD